MKNDGSKAEEIFDNKISELGKRAYVHKFKDTKHVKGLSRAGMALKQPADRFMCLDGRSAFIEIKSTHNETRFQRSLIRKHQIGAARMLTAAGGSYDFYVLNMNTHQWYRVPAEFVLGSDAKSWTWEELDEFKFTWPSL